MSERARGGERPPLGASGFSATPRRPAGRRAGWPAPRRLKGPRAAPGRLIASAASPRRGARSRTTRPPGPAGPDAVRATLRRAGAQEVRAPQMPASVVSGTALPPPSPPPPLTPPPLVPAARGSAARGPVVPGVARICRAGSEGRAGARAGLEGGDSGRRRPRRSGLRRASPVSAKGFWNRPLDRIQWFIMVYNGRFVMSGGIWRRVGCRVRRGRRRRRREEGGDEGAEARVGEEAAVAERPAGGGVGAAGRRKGSC